MTINSTTHTTSSARRRITTVGAMFVAAGAIAFGAAAVANAIPPGGINPHPAQPIPQWVAIAFSPDNGAHGWTNGADSVQMAQSGALGHCRAAGGDQCQIVVSAHSSGLQNQCAALFAEPAADNYNHKWGPAHVGTGPTLDAAEQAATNPATTYDTGIPLIVRCATGDGGQG
jgi:hypothetical protein